MDQRTLAGMIPKWYVCLDEGTWTATIIQYNDDDEETKINIPFEYIKCCICGGSGYHVNPTIDSHGITTEEWDRDWSYEDKQNYLNGMYDIPCNSCDGNRVIAVIDENRATQEQKDYVTNKIQEDYDYAKLVESERRYGC